MKRSEAKRLGLHSYQPDAPCVRDHDCERWTSNGVCKDCQPIWRNRLTRLYSARFRAKKLNVLVVWANDEAIKKIYENCPDDMEVDHIVPLQGTNVCGLHVETNLQYLTHEENRRKGIRFYGNSKKKNKVRRKSTANKRYGK